MFDYLKIFLKRISYFAAKVKLFFIDKILYKILTS